MLTQSEWIGTTFCDAKARSHPHRDNLISEVLFYNEAMAVSKGDKVRIKRPESYWFNEVGTVASVVAEGGGRYPVTVRFQKVDYKVYSGTDGGVTTANYAESELEPA